MGVSAALRETGMFRLAHRCVYVVSLAQAGFLMVKMLAFVVVTVFCMFLDTTCSFGRD